MNTNLNWTFEDALLELIANAYDDDKNSDITYDEATQSCVIVNRLSERGDLEIEHFNVNTTTKRGALTTGQYGCGLSDAIAVLLKFKSSYEARTERCIFRATSSDETEAGKGLLAIEHEENSNGKAGFVVTRIGNVQKKSFEGAMARSFHACLARKSLRKIAEMNVKCTIEGEICLP